jgi:DNA-directed RNA polymerase subunit RPC12/RpoP
MPTKIEEGDRVFYACNVCGKKFWGQILRAVECELNHKIIYVPIFQEDLQGLVNFLFTGDSANLSQRLIETVMSYSRIARNEKPNAIDLSDM